jgi:hypothetical protein
MHRDAINDGLAGREHQGRHVAIRLADGGTSICPFVRAETLDVNADPITAPQNTDWGVEAVPNEEGHDGGRRRMLVGDSELEALPGSEETTAAREGKNDHGCHVRSLHH